jgi:hypothetical protein
MNKLYEIKKRWKKFEMGIRFIDIGIKDLSRYKFKEIMMKLGLKDKDFINQIL